MIRIVTTVQLLEAEFMWTFEPLQIQKSFLIGGQEFSNLFHAAAKQKSHSYNLALASPWSLALLSQWGRIAQI